MNTMLRRPAPTRHVIATGLLAVALAACQSNASPGPGTNQGDNGGAGGAGSSGDVPASLGPTSTGGTGVTGSGSPAASGGAGTADGSGTAGGGVGDGSLALEQAFETVVRDVGPSIVLIQTTEGLGSGVVYDDAGNIVTNAHVVGTEKSFKVTTSSGDTLDATLVGTFTAGDLAVIHVTGGSLKPASFGDSSQLVVGQVVLALGNPLGLQSSVTDGIISALGRTLNEEGGAALPGMIQTSAPINPGNSGGALVTLREQVVGIPTLTATDPQLGGVAPGIGFAIPSSIAADIARQLVANGEVVSSHRAYLGIRAADVQGAKGVLVFSVDPSGPAANAGVPEGVLITSIGGQPVDSSSALSSILANLQPGQAVDVTIQRRDGSSDTIKVTLGELPG
jgi:putative serine protease PepD